MQLTVLAVLLSTCSVALACAGRGPCHDGPPQRFNFNNFRNTKGVPVVPFKKMRRSLDPYTLHVARQAVLAARGFYDDDSEFGNLYAREAEYDDLHAREAEFDDDTWM